VNIIYKLSAHDMNNIHPNTLTGESTMERYYEDIEDAKEFAGFVSEEKEKLDWSPVGSGLTSGKLSDGITYMIFPIHVNERRSR